jgi:hypothetical protein
MSARLTLASNPGYYPATLSADCDGLKNQNSQLTIEVSFVYYTLVSSLPSISLCESYGLPGTERRGENESLATAEKQIELTLHLLLLIILFP